MRKKLPETIKDIISKLSISQDLSREFKTALIIENIRRLIYILVIVIIFQIVFIFLEAAVL